MVNYERQLYRSLYYPSHVHNLNYLLDYFNMHPGLLSFYDEGSLFTENSNSTNSDQSSIERKTKRKYLESGLYS